MLSNLDVVGSVVAGASIRNSYDVPARNPYSPESYYHGVQRSRRSKQAVRQVRCRFQKEEAPVQAEKNQTRPATA